MRKPAVYSLLIAALLFVAGPLYAADTAVLDITPPSSAPDLPAKGPDLHYGKFDGYGVIDSIAAAKVVIDDTLYRLSPKVVYKYRDGSKTGRSTTADNFPVGTSVWFVLYPDNTIKSVWKEGG